MKPIPFTTLLLLWFAPPAFAQAPAAPAPPSIVTRGRSIVTARPDRAFVTIAAEGAVALIALVLVTRGERIQYFFKGLAVVPLRYVLIVSELVTVGRFAVDLWITKNRKWRK